MMRSISPSIAAEWVTCRSWIHRSGAGKIKSAILPQTQRELSWAEADRYKERTMIERVNGRIKDEFGGRHIRVRGASKIMAHLIFGVLALTVDQMLKLLRLLYRYKYY
jgi:hypothetical protein